MKRLIIASCLAWVAEVGLCAAGRVTVLDMGLEAGVTNGFGCASAPAAFVRALGGTYDVRVVPHATAIADGAAAALNACRAVASAVATSLVSPLESRLGRKSTICCST